MLRITTKIAIGEEKHEKNTFGEGYIMNEIELQQGIEILYDMELNNYYTERGIRRLDYEINNLARSRNIAAPIRREVYIFPYDDSAVALWVWAFFGALLGLLYCCKPSGFFDLFFEIFVHFDEAIRGVIVGAICGVVVGFICFFIRCIGEKKKCEQEYEANLRIYNEEVQMDTIRIENEKKQQKILIGQREVLKNRLATARNYLNDFYDRVGIDKNYRYLIPIGYMSEFLQLGIATKLTGIDGLYYLVRKELRMDQMQASLDEILDKLDQIIDNQHMLHGQLVSMNEKCEQMIQTELHNSKSLDKVIRNTGVTAYNSERARRELEYQSFLMTWNRMWR